MVFWMIVCIDNGTYKLVIGNPDGVIDNKHRPKAVYFNQELAEKDLLGLKEKNPNNEFVLLESVAVCQGVEGKRGAFRLEDMENFII